MKILFFHIPILGHYNSIEPVLLELVQRGHTVSHYNHAGFSRYLTKASIPFTPYAEYEGYLPDRLTSRMNVYDLGLMLLETAEHTLDFVASECLRERPDAILHSKFAAAPKVIARKQGLPAACLTTAFVFHPNAVRDAEGKSNGPVMLSNIASVRTFRAKAKTFYERHLGERSDPNDVFMNEEALTLVLGLELFQPRTHDVSARHTFVGPTVQIEHYSKVYDLIYVSFGAVFVDNVLLVRQCIEALGTIGRRTIISLGGRLSPAQFDPVPPNIELTCFAPQKDVLQQAALFITHGGGNSVYEAIYCETPMIVIPQIPEQLVFARQIERLGLGRCLLPQDLSVARLRSTVMEVLDDDLFRRNVRALKETWPTIPPAVTAADCIEAMARAW